MLCKIILKLGDSYYRMVRGCKENGGKVLRNGDENLLAFYKGCILAFYVEELAQNMRLILRLVFIWGPSIYLFKFVVEICLVRSNFFHVRGPARVV